MHFHTVWYRFNSPTTIRDTLPVFRDVGALTLAPDAVTFHGKKWHVRFPLSRVTRVIYGRQGLDWVNTWVTLESPAGEQMLLKDGRLLGWRGILGGTRHIFNEIARLTTQTSPNAQIIKRNQITRAGYALFALSVILWFASDHIIYAILWLWHARRHRRLF